MKKFPWLYWLVCLLFAVDAACMLRWMGMSQGWDAAMVDVAPCAAAILMLIVLGYRAGVVEVSAPRAFALGALAGVAFFFRTCGFALLDPTNIDWLLNGDWAQHYSGWEMFRAAPWSWPPGRVPALLYPVGSSIVYTDSLPLLALLLKPFEAWLPHPFQYIGIWMLLSCTLLGGFGALLVRLRTRDPAAMLAGALFFLYAPIFIARFGHDTLTAHWLLLAALLLYFRAPPVRGESRPWLALNAVASLVHPYLWFMLLALQVAYWARRVWVDRDVGYRSAMTCLAACCAVAVALWWLSGAFIIPRTASTGGIPYGVFSMNLFAPIDPRGFSRMLPTLPMGQGQHEGFAFLGAGMIFLVVLAGVLAWRHQSRFSFWRNHWPIIAMAVLCALFAISTVVRIGGTTLIDWPIKASWLGTFRSSGRFIWVAYYLVMAGTLFTLAARLKAGTAALVLTAALALQMWEVWPEHANYVYLRHLAADPTTRLHDPRWHTLAQGKKHLTLLPPNGCGEAAGNYLPFTLLAASEHLTINMAYLARWNEESENAYCARLDRQWRSGQFDLDEIFVLGPDWRELFHARQPQANCLMLDGYEACVLPATNRAP